MDSSERGDHPPSALASVSSKEEHKKESVFYLPAYEHAIDGNESSIRETYVYGEAKINISYFVLLTHSILGVKRNSYLGLLKAAKMDDVQARGSPGGAIVSSEFYPALPW